MICDLKIRGGGGGFKNTFYVVISQWHDLKGCTNLQGPKRCLEEVQRERKNLISHLPVCSYPRRSAETIMQRSTRRRKEMACSRKGSWTQRVHGPALVRCGSRNHKTLSPPLSRKPGYRTGERGEREDASIFAPHGVYNVRPRARHASTRGCRCRGFVLGRAATHRLDSPGNLHCIVIPH